MNSYVMEKYRISILHFNCLEYEDLLNNKKMIIDIDLRDKYKIVSLDCLSNWDVPYENEIIDEEIKLELVNNIYSFLCNNFGKKYVINTLDKYFGIKFFFINPFYYLSRYLHQKQTRKLIQKKHEKLRDQKLYRL